VRIIVSPAKKMRADDVLPWDDVPVLLERTDELLAWMRGLSRDECQRLWGCSDRLADLNYERLVQMDVRHDLTPALMAYVGIQYQYMAADVLDESAYDYLRDHLRILSGFYGVLRPFDGVAPYRLEMGAKVWMDGCTGLYDFWGDALYHEVMPEDRTVLNLASKEYSACVEKHLQSGDRFVTCVFGELVGERVVQKGTLAKMARGEMVRYLAECQVQEPEDARAFDRLGYVFDEARSDDGTYVFIKQDDAA